MQRRDFLKMSTVAATAASSGLTGLSPVTGQENRLQALTRKPVLVKIFLRGGQDQLNTFIPHADKTYYSIRPTIAVRKTDAILLNDMWALHPALEPLKRYFDEGRFAAVINSGSPHPTRSHFDAQDFMEYAAPGNRMVRDGWLNRFLTATKNPRGEDPNQIRAIALQERLPRSMRGAYPAVAVPPNLREIDEVLDLFEDFYRGGDPEKLPTTLNAVEKAAGPGRAVGIDADPVMASGMQTIQYLRRLRQLLYGDEKPTYGSSRGDGFESGTFQEYPGGWFASRLKALARIIKADVGLQVVGTDINGWDHHIGLGSTDGTLDRMLEFLSASLAAFMDDLGPELDRTLILVSTEFGRVCAENGNDGSDHGHGGATWLLGGRVRGGRIYGKWTGLEPSELNDKRDLKVTTDFREIYADVLREHMGFALPDGFFPDYQPSERGLGLFG
ncbi:MAG: DUF1501 domain-containing protein [Planctomycetaceae bacterium]|nr:DUF1501 domain-containing protein [Planctomycetaceae bacterium]